MGCERGAVHVLLEGFNANYDQNVHKFTVGSRNPFLLWQRKLISKTTLKILIPVPKEPMAQIKVTEPLCKSVSKHSPESSPKPPTLPQPIRETIDNCIVTVIAIKYCKIINYKKLWFYQCLGN